MSIEKPQPESSAVFETTKGEKIRIEFDRIYVYKSNNNKTTVELGWAPQTETYMLDIKFEDFDAQVMANKKAWKDYWAANRDYY